MKKNKEEKPVILIVEDDPRQAEYIVESLNRTQLYTVLSAQNGLEALKIIKENERGLGFLSNKIACILLDWQMPVMNGEQFIKILREQEHQSLFKKYIPIVISSILSGNDRYELSRDSRLGMVSGYLVKPIDLTELANIMHRIVYQHDAETLRELFFSQKSRWMEIFKKEAETDSDQEISKMDLYTLEQKQKIFQRKLIKIEEAIQTRLHEK